MSFFAEGLTHVAPVSECPSGPDAEVKATALNAGRVLPAVKSEGVVAMADPAAALLQALAQLPGAVLSEDTGHGAGSTNPQVGEREQSPPRIRQQPKGVWLQGMAALGTAVDSMLAFVAGTDSIALQPLVEVR